MIVEDQLVCASQNGFQMKLRREALRRRFLLTVFVTPALRSMHSARTQKCGRSVQSSAVRNCSALYSICWQRYCESSPFAAATGEILPLRRDAMYELKLLAFPLIFCVQRREINFYGGAFCRYVQIILWTGMLFCLVERGNHAGTHWRVPAFSARSGCVLWRRPALQAVWRFSVPLSRAP